MSREADHISSAKGENSLLFACLCILGKALDLQSKREKQDTTRSCQKVPFERTIKCALKRGAVKKMGRRLTGGAQTRVQGAPAELNVHQEPIACGHITQTTLEEL